MSIINRKKNKYDKIWLLAKTKLISTEVLTFRALINSYFSHDGSILVHDMLKEYDDMNKKIKTLMTSPVHQRF